MTERLGGAREQNLVHDGENEPTPQIPPEPRREKSVRVGVSVCDSTDKTIYEQTHKPNCPCSLGSEPVHMSLALLCV